MASKIDLLETKPTRITSSSAVRANPGASSGAGGKPQSGSPDVHLSGGARNLAAIEQSLRALPAVDELRVAAVKQRLAEGSYEIDPQRIADRLLRLDSDLSRAAPLESKTLR